MLLCMLPGSIYDALVQLHSLWGLTCSVQNQVKAAESRLVIGSFQRAGVNADHDGLVCGVCEAIPTNQSIAIDRAPKANEINAVSGLSHKSCRSLGYSTSAERAHKLLDHIAKSCSATNAGLDRRSTSERMVFASRCRYVPVNRVRLMDTEHSRGAETKHHCCLK